MSHHCIDWIPSEVALKLNIFWTLDIDFPEYDLPKVWVEHGIPDNHVVKKQQYHDDIHYLCSNEWTYNKLKEQGLMAYHTGSIFLDKTIPRLFVYAPQHSRMEQHSLPTEWNHPPKNREELEQLCKEYECDDFVTSIVDDTKRDLYNDLNPIMSNRFHGLGLGHFKKCKYLYENAKVIYADIMSTFDITGEAYGIPILGRDNQKMPKEYSKINVHTDGKCCTRIMETLNEIIRHN